MRLLGEMIVGFASRPDAALGFRLAMLWPRWRAVLGDVAPYARPLGHRRKTLLAGVDDALAMQESLYDSPWILERVNGFLGQQVFDKVQFDLLHDKTPLDMATGAAVIFRQPTPPCIKSLGGLRLDQNSVVGRAYAACVRQFGPGSDRRHAGHIE